MHKVLIGIPMYNCESQIEKVFQDIQEFLKAFNSQTFQIEQIIFLDNHSTDQTINRIKSVIPAHSKFTVAQNTENLGLGGSHKSLFSYAQQNGFNHVAIVHGDHQANATELNNLLQLSESHQACTVLGSRFNSSSQRMGYSHIRTLGNRMLNLIYSLLLQKSIQDLGSGLNLFNVSEFDLITVKKFDNQFTFNMDLTIYLSKYIKNVLYTPISWKSEDEVSNARTFQVGWETLFKIITWTIFREKIWKISDREYFFQTI